MVDTVFFHAIFARPMNVDPYISGAILHLLKMKMASGSWSWKMDDKNTEIKEVMLHEGDGLMSAEQLTKCKNAVCMIRLKTRCPDSGQRLLKQGSGFYAKAKICGVEYCCIVTANHVIRSKEEAMAAVVIFHFERENQGTPIPLRPDKIFETNQMLDYSVIGVDEYDLSRINPLIYPIQYSAQPQAVVGDDVFIFQHPSGKPKQFSYEKIIRIEHPFVYYVTDTETGSSGSPVLWKLQLMAIHLVGSKEEAYNKGTLFSAVIDDLQHRHNANNALNCLNLKRNFNCVTRTPTEMEEKSCKRLCADNNDEKMTVGTDEENSDLTKGANSVLDEMQPVRPDDKFLNNLSRDCCTFYKQLGRQLGVTHEKIEEINKDNVNYNSLPDKCFQMFQAWKDSNDSEFTMEALEKALRDMKKNGLANKLFGKK